MTNEKALYLLRELRREIGNDGYWLALDHAIALLSPSDPEEETIEFRQPVGIAGDTWFWAITDDETDYIITARLPKPQPREIAARVEKVKP
jgi:hypothetical protein